MGDVVFAGKTIAIIGMARTGMATAEVLTDLGANVRLFDRRPAEDLREQITEAEKLGAAAYPGHPGVDLVGVDLLVTSPGVPMSSPIFEEAREMTVEVISEIELAYRISKAPILAITGTNGKTTTAVLLGRIMEADGRETYIAGNVAAGEIKLPLVKAAHQATKSGVIVAEISTFQLEWISSFRPKIAALLNIGVDHLDRHTFDEYAALKARIFENQAEGDFSVVNLDNEPSASAGKGVRSKVLQFSRLEPVEQGAFIDGDVIKVRIDGRETAACSLSDIGLPGTHNLENVLAAVCAAIAFGVRPESVVRALHEFAGVEHRMEKVATIDGIAYINNSMCTNPDAFARSIEAVVGRPVVIAGGKHKGGEGGAFDHSSPSFRSAAIAAGSRFSAGPQPPPPPDRTTSTSPGRSSTPVSFVFRSRSVPSACRSV
jgi:UDP-N-acetylmuramoylalanine--D-glutamate ligase